MKNIIKKLEGNAFSAFSVSEDGTLTITNEDNHSIRSRCYIISSSIGNSIMIGANDCSGSDFVNGEPFAILREEKLYINNNEWVSFKKFNAPDKYYLSLVLHQKGGVFFYFGDNMRSPIIHRIENIGLGQEWIAITLNLLSVHNSKLAKKLKGFLFKIESEDDSNG